MFYEWHINIRSTVEFKSNDGPISSVIKSPRIAIIGGDISGLSCAQALAESSIAATIFDKRSVGV